MTTKKQEQNGKTVIERMQEQYEALPTAEKKEQFINRWNAHIADLGGLLRTTADYEQYKKLSSKIDKIQKQLKEIVEELSVNVK